ncbi:hypothetical protein SALBM135S_03683 [Streptomyces alboniger]
MSPPRRRPPRPRWRTRRMFVSRKAGAAEAVRERVVPGHVPSRAPHLLEAGPGRHGPSRAWYSSMPRISKEMWCREVCGPFASAMEWCWELIRRWKCTTSPMCGELSVSDRAKPEVALVPLASAVEVGGVEDDVGEFDGDRLLLLDPAVLPDRDVGGDLDGASVDVEEAEAVAAAGGVDACRAARATARRPRGVVRRACRRPRGRRPRRRRGRGASPRCAVRTPPTAPAARSPTRQRPGCSATLDRPQTPA